MTMRGAWLLALAAAGSDAAACSCADADAMQGLERAQTIALVRIRQVEVNPDWLAQLATQGSYAQPLRAEADVLEMLRGMPTPGMTLYGGRGEGGCGLPLEPGEDVLLVDAGTGDEFELPFCSESRVLGMGSLLEAAGHPVQLSFERLYLRAVRDFLTRGTPIHGCLLYRVPPPPQPPDADPDETRVDCWAWLREQSQEPLR